MELFYQNVYILLKTVSFVIKRTMESRILSSIKQWPVTLITGARQVGKSFLCSKIAEDMGFSYVSLDNPMERKTAIKDPEEFLRIHQFPLVIDEVQYAPELFDHIEFYVNKRKLETGNNYGMYILTGSQSYSLMQNVTQSLAGRVNVMVMHQLSSREINNEKETPFSIDNARDNASSSEKGDIYDRIVRGFYPELHDGSGKDYKSFYGNYVASYLYRDVSQMMNVVDKVAFSDFLSVVASLTGQELVYENIAKEVQVSSKTIKSWISILEAGHIVRLLKPYYDTSIVNRVVKHPKLYFTDTGLACYLAGIPDGTVLEKSFFKGRFFETYVVNEIIKSYDNNGEHCEFSYFRDNNGNEIDLLIFHDFKVTMIEIKAGVMFDKADVSAFKYIRAGSREVVGGCLICNTEKPYVIDKDVLAIPERFI